MSQESKYDPILLFYFLLRFFLSLFLVLEDGEMSKSHLEFIEL